MFAKCCKKLFEAHIELADGGKFVTERSKITVVVVVDECGAHLELLRGFIAMADSFQNSISEYKFKGVLLTFVGTGLDLAMRNDDCNHVASDPSLYEMMTLEPWDTEKALTYARKYESGGISTIDMVAGFDAAFRYPLLRALSTNARAVTFLHSVVRAIFLQYTDRVSEHWPKMIVDNNVSLIFQQTVQKYLLANGIGSLKKREPRDFNNYISIALSCAVTGKLPSAEEKMDACRDCLFYGRVSS